MKLYILLNVFCITKMRTFSQGVSILDISLKETLVTNFDTNLNGDIESQIEEAIAYNGIIYLSNKNLQNINFCIATKYKSFKSYLYK